MTVANILIFLQKAKTACNLANVTLRLPVFVLGAYDRLLLAVSRAITDAAATLRDIKRHHWGVRDATLDITDAVVTIRDRRVAVRRRLPAMAANDNRRMTQRRAIDRAQARCYRTIPIARP